MAQTVVATGAITITDFHDINIQNTPPQNPVVDQLWLDSSQVPNVLKRWDGTQWVIVNTPGPNPNQNFKIRYIRDFINGNSVNSGNHWVEAQVFSKNTNIAKDLFPTFGTTDATNTIRNVLNLQRVTDENTNTSSYTDIYYNEFVTNKNISSWTKNTEVTITSSQADPYGGTSAYKVQSTIASNGTNYYGVSFNISGDKTGKTLAYGCFVKADADNVDIEIGTNSFGNNLNTHYNISSEWQYISSTQSGVVANYFAVKLMTTNAIYIYNPWVSDNTGTPGLTYMQLDLKTPREDIDYLRIWHYFGDSRQYNSTKTQVSEDGVKWFTLYDCSVDNKYTETSIGHLVNVSLSGTVSSTANKLTDIGVNILPDNIYAGIKTTQSYKNDLNEIAGKNRWLIKKYNVANKTDFKPKYEDLFGKITSKTFEMLDDVSILNTNITQTSKDFYICVASTYVNVINDISIFTTTMKHNHGTTIYINGNIIYEAMSATTNTALTMNFIKGWNKIEIFWYENTIDDKFNLGIKLSENPNVINMSCYYNIETISESRIKIAEKEIDTKVQYDNVIAAINLSAQEDGSQIKIQADKVQLEGLVKITDLNGTGEVIIDGSRIKGGELELGGDYDGVLSIKDASGNEIVRGDTTGITIDGGYYKIENEQILNTAVPTRNLIANPSYENCILGNFDSTNAYYSISRMQSWDTTPVGTGSPRIRAITNEVVLSDRKFVKDGLYSLIVNSTNYYTQGVFAQAGQTFTLSAYVKRDKGVTSNVTSKLVIYCTDTSKTTSSTPDLTSTIILTDDNWHRHIYNFTVPNLRTGTAIIEIGILTSDANWMVVDAVQLVEGNLPALYMPDSLDMYGYITPERLEFGKIKVLKKTDTGNQGIDFVIF